MAGCLTISSMLVFFNAEEPGVITVSAMVFVLGALETMHFNNLRFENLQNLSDSATIQESNQGMHALDTSVSDA